jgi:hypothetical protein
MASPADIRAWARQNGHDVPERGNLPKGLREEYETFHGDLSAADDPGPDYDGGVSDDDFTAASDPPPDEPAEETKPRRTRPARGQRTTAFRERVWGQKKTGAKKRKAKHPRVPVDKIVSSGWRLMARFVAPVDVPVSRVLQTQAPVAGALLEPVVKQTMLDTVLQPLARLQESGEVLTGLAGPPVLVGLLHRFPEASHVLVPMLEEALVSWFVISGPAVMAAEEKRAEFEAEYGDRMKALLQLWFAGIPGFDPNVNEDGSPRVPPEEDPAARAEDEAMAGAQGML